MHRTAEVKWPNEGKWMEEPIFSISCLNVLEGQISCCLGPEKNLLLHIVLEVKKLYIFLRTCYKLQYLCSISIQINVPKPHPNPIHERLFLHQYVPNPIQIQPDQSLGFQKPKGVGVFSFRFTPIRPTRWPPPGGPSSDSLKCQWTNAVCTTALVFFLMTGCQTGGLQKIKGNTIFFGWVLTVPGLVSTNIAAWNIPIFNRKYIFKGYIFHCYVRLPECNCQPFEGFLWKKLTPYQQLPDDPEDQHLIIHLRILTMKVLGNQKESIPSTPQQHQNETSKKQGQDCCSGGLTRIQDLLQFHWRELPNEKNGCGYWPLLELQQKTVTPFAPTLK